MKVRKTYIDGSGVRKYRSRLVERSRFQCPNGTQGAIVKLQTKIEDKKAIGEDQVCLDYLKYEEKEPGVGTHKTVECCGDNECETTDISNHTLEVTFRSGFGGNDEGFNMTIMCWDTQAEAAINQETCLQMSDENQVTSIDSYFDDFKNYYYEYFDAIKQQV